MKKWVLKAIFQKVISYLPFKHRINFFFQKYVTRGVQLSDEYFEDRLIHAANHIRGYSNLSSRNVPAKTLELGTGWYPVVPFMLYLCGSEEIHSIDIARLTNRERLLTTVQKILLYLNDESRRHLFGQFKLIPERVNKLEEIERNKEQITESDLLSSLNITLSVGDAGKTSYPENYFDLTHSNNTFEHVFPIALKNILTEFSRVTNKEYGVMSHFIDMSDHFAHFDKSISIYNFLKFSESQWKWIDNNVQPMNRLRLPDYLKIYEELKIPVSRMENRPGNPEQLAALQIDPMFRHYSDTELAVSHSYLFSAWKK